MSLKLDSFDTELGQRVVFGEGALERLGLLAAELDGSRVLLVTDPGLVSAGHVDRAVRGLAQSGQHAIVYSNAVENPDSRSVAAAAEFAASVRPDLIVGLGGGSAMDTAKGVNFIFSNGGQIKDYWGSGKATSPMLPSIGVPTTAGTGSEAQSYALISDSETGRKMACGDRKARFRSVILDPGLVETAPAEVKAASAIDAVSHALESHVCTRANPFSRVFSREAWKLLDGSIETALGGSAHTDALGRLLLGAYMAGMAIECSMLGAAHASANPLTARFGVVHGVAIGLMLPHVIRFNLEATNGVWEDLAEACQPARLADRVEELRQICLLPQRLSDCSIPRDSLPQLAEEATREWTGKFNPRPLESKDFLQLYRQAW